MHLEYILTELLKNSFRATIEAGMEREPIEITIAPAPATAEETEQLKLKTERDEDIVKHSSDSAAASGAHNTVGVISNYDQGSVDFASGSRQSQHQASGQADAWRHDSDSRPWW